MSSKNLNMTAIPGVREINDGAAEKCSGGRKPDVVLYEHANFRGKRLNIWDSRKFVGDIFNDKTSSFVINRGRWQFYDDANYGGARTQVLGPKGIKKGRYNLIEDEGLPHDVLSSLKREKGS